MSRRSVAAALLALALVCAGHALALTFDSSRYLPAATAAPSREWTGTRELARQSSCPEVIVNLLEQAAATDDSERLMNRAAAQRLASEIRTHAINSAVFAIVLLVLGVLARRGAQVRPAS